MESLTESGTKTIVIVEDTDDVVVIEYESLRVHSFADDPFVVDWAPPQS
jgi:hypothetical protein